MMGLDIWAGLESAPTFERGTFLPPGFQGVVQIAKCLVKATQQSGICLIVEVEVMSSNNGTDPPGSLRSWIVKLDNKAVALPNVKAWVYAVLGLQQSNPNDAPRCQAVDQVIKGLVNLACSERNAFRGALVNLETTHTTTKTGGDFTVHKWTPAQYPEGYPAPNWGDLMQVAPSAINAAPTMQAAAPAWGAPPPAWGAPPPIQPQAPRWGASPSPNQPPAPAWGAPPLVQVAPPVQAPGLPPGAQVQNGHYWAPGMPNWLPVPR